MNMRITTILLAVALLLVAGVSRMQAAPLPQSEGGEIQAAPAGDYDFTTHGTSWVRQIPAQFSLFRTMGWGTQAKVKAAGDQWVHIAVPYQTRIANTLMKIKFVQFCAQSSNGGVTKPVRMDLWSYDGLTKSVLITWPANNNKNCFTYEFPTPEFQPGLGVSVLLHYANPTHMITLYHAWVRIVP